MTSCRKVNFESLGVKIVGDLYLPNKFTETEKYKSVVMTPPFPQVKDQCLSNYGPKFAESGFVALAFDYVSKGESDSYKRGFRNDDNMSLKWEALRNAISFLGSQPFVDKDNIFGLGICGGGNIMSSTIITDLRVRAFGSVSAMMASDAMFYADPEAFRKLVTSANKARQEMFETGKPVSADYFGFEDPQYLEKNPGLTPSQKEGYEYYGTARGGTARYPNFSCVLMSNINETAALNLGEHYADKILQPYCGIVGEHADTRFATDTFYEKVTSPKELHTISGATHVSLYDNQEQIKEVVGLLTAFYNKHSRPSTPRPRSAASK